MDRRRWPIEHKEKAPGQIQVAVFNLLPCGAAIGGYRAGAGLTPLIVHTLMLLTALVHRK